MEQKGMAKIKVSIRMLYGWSLGLMMLGFGLLYLILFIAQRTSCANDCQTFFTFGDIIRPIGIVLFLSGLVLLLWNTGRHVVRTIRR